MSAVSNYFSSDYHSQVYLSKLKIIIMKKTIKKFVKNEMSNTQAIKGGAFGRGTRNTSSQAGTRAELL